MLDPRSQSRLANSHPLLRKLFLACAADPACPTFRIEESQRGRQAQERAFALGHSRAHFGQSAHNFNPAVALDVVPFASGKLIDWEATPKFKALAAFVLAKAKTLGIQITWGGTFPKLVDMPHYELADWKTLVATGKVKRFNG
jgi:peptidoglycan L-alanyl-D-glutamate endopeptidase CwlK